jgi:hypothetical protein
MRLILIFGSTASSPTFSNLPWGEEGLAALLTYYTSISQNWCWEYSVTECIYYPILMNRYAAYIHMPPPGIVKVVKSGDRYYVPETCKSPYTLL